MRREVTAEFPEVAVSRKKRRSEREFRTGYPGSRIGQSESEGNDGEG